MKYLGLCSLVGNGAKYKSLSQQMQHIQKNTIMSVQSSVLGKWVRLRVQIWQDQLGCMMWALAGHRYHGYHSV